MPPVPLDYETPGKKPGFELAVLCPACGKDGAVRGTLVGGEQWYFFPSGMKGATPAYSYACVACGVVTTVIDPDELREALGVRAGTDTAAARPNGSANVAQP